MTQDTTNTERPATVGSNAAGVASFVVGIIAAVVAIVSPGTTSTLFAIIGLALGASGAWAARKKPQLAKWQWIAGLALSVFAFVVAFLVR